MPFNWKRTWFGKDIGILSLCFRCYNGGPVAHFKHYYARCDTLISRGKGNGPCYCLAELDYKKINAS